MRLFLDRFFMFYLWRKQKMGAGTWLEIALPGPISLRQVLVDLGIPAGEVYLAVVNHQAMENVDIQVNDNDEVRLYPPFGGG